MSSYLCPYYSCNNTGHFYFLLRLLKLSSYGSSCLHFFLISHPFSMPQIPSIKNHLSFSGSSLSLNESPNPLTWPMSPLHCLFHWPHFLQLLSPTPSSTYFCFSNSVSLIFSPDIYAVLFAQNILTFLIAWMPNRYTSILCMCQDFRFPGLR